MSVSAFATSREEIAKICVSQEGDFTYWNENSAVLQSLKVYTLQGIPVSTSYNGIVVKR